MGAVGVCACLQGRKGGTICWKMDFFVDGKYKILDVIGRGGMSIVYLAINEKANRSWAVKELIRTDPRAAGISKKETDLLKKLHHPGIAGIVDVIEQKESQLIVMDYVEGHSLDQVLEEQGVCSEREVLDIGIQLCEVLEYLHTSKAACDLSGSEAI